MKVINSFVEAQLLQRKKFLKNLLISNFLLFSGFVIQTEQLIPKNTLSQQRSSRFPWETLNTNFVKESEKRVYFLYSICLFKNHNHSHWPGEEMKASCFIHITWTDSYTRQAHQTIFNTQIRSFEGRAIILEKIVA